MGLARWGLRVGGRASADPVALSGGIGAVGRRCGGVGWRVGGGRVVNVCGRDSLRRAAGNGTNDGEM